MKLKKLFNALTGSLILGSLLIAFSGCYGNRNYCPQPCAVMEPCAPYGPDCKPCATLDCCDYSLVKRTPNSVAVGCPFESIYEFCPKTDLMDVEFTDKIPDNAEYLDSSPKAELIGNTLRWSYKRLDQGDLQQIRVTLRARDVGCLKDCICAKAIPCACTIVCVGRPELQICKEGPDEICMSSCGTCKECATFAIHVRNCGNFRAEDVVITDLVPDGLAHASGKRELRLDVGCLEPGESTTANITLEPTRCGCHCNVARVTYGCENRCAEASACVTVLCPKVAIKKTGPAMQYIQHCGERPVCPYTITVTNIGDMCLTNLLVTDFVAQGNFVIDAGGGCVSGCNVTWNIPSLGCGESTSFCIVLAADCPGCYVNEACVQGNPRCPVCDSACIQTEWKGEAALSVCVCDSCDPLFECAETCYTIQIISQGSIPDTNVKVTALLPDQVEYVSAGGSTGAHVSGRTVTFDTIPCLAPGQTATYTIQVRACCPGNGRLKVQVGSDSTQPPINAEESTKVLRRC